MPVIGAKRILGSMRGELQYEGDDAVRRVRSLNWMRHDTEKRKESKSLYGVTVLLGKARKAERKKQRKDPG